MSEFYQSYKNIPYHVIVTGIIIIFIASLILKKEIAKSMNKSKFLFIMDNLEIVGLLCFGIILIVLAFI